MNLNDKDIFIDDLGYDVKEFYLCKLREGLSPEEAEKEVLIFFKHHLDDNYKQLIVVLALAESAWKLGRVSDKLQKLAVRIIEEGDIIANWRSCGRTVIIKKQTALWKLRKKLMMPCPESKRLYMYKMYKCEWNIGDVYAYRLRTEFSRVRGYSGRYIIIQKADQCSWFKGHIVPIVYFWLTDDETLPDINDIDHSDILNLGIAQKYPKKLYRYRGKLLNASKRVIPRNIIYLGNMEVKKHPDEYIPSDSTEYPFFSWSSIEERIIRLYDEYN